MFGSHMSQPLLVPLNHLGGLSTLARSVALARRNSPSAWLAPHTMDHLARMWVTKPPTYVDHRVDGATLQQPKGRGSPL